MVVPGTHTDYLADHPQRPALVVEVAHSSLAFDRGRKGSLYARGGVPDYWIVNLVDRELEIYRAPVSDATAAYGWRYRSVAHVTPAGEAALLVVPAVRLAVADLLP